VKKDLRKVSPKKNFGSRISEGTRKGPKALNALGQRHFVPLRRHIVPLSEKARSALRHEVPLRHSILYPTSTIDPHHNIATATDRDHRPWHPPAALDCSCSASPLIQRPISPSPLLAQSDFRKPSTIKQRSSATNHLTAEVDITASPSTAVNMAQDNTCESPAPCPRPTNPSNHPPSFIQRWIKTNKQTGRSRGTPTMKTKSPAISQTTAPMPTELASG
jgi:hypothetical protein